MRITIVVVATISIPIAVGDLYTCDIAHCISIIIVYMHTNFQSFLVDLILTANVLTQM